MSPLNGSTESSVNTSVPVDPTYIFGPQRDSLYIVLPITIIYTLIFITGLRETSITGEQNQKDFESSIRHSQKIRRKHSQSTRRVIKMIVAVVIAFFICWAPFHAQRLVAIYGTTEDHLAKSPILLSVYSLLTYTSGVFYYMSTCINPIFYHIMSNKFRDAFKNTMTTWCCRKKKGNAIKRCSYTAMAFVRNPTTSGTINSGNSLKNEASFRNRSRNLDNNGNSNKQMNGGHNGLMACSQHNENQQQNNGKDSLVKCHDINNIESINGRKMKMPVSCTYQSPILAKPEAFILSEYSDKSGNSQDDPENYLQEVKLKLKLREKEYR